MREFVILLYHGVTSAKPFGVHNMSKKHIPVSEFEAQMKYLSEHRTVLRMSELAGAWEDPPGQPPVVVTFDDGFENNYTQAFPVLKKYGVPATFYVSTELLDSRGVFWVDKIEYHVNETTQDVFESALLGRTWPLGDSEQKIKALLEIKRVLKADCLQAEGVIEEMERSLGVPPRYDYPDYRTLSRDQILEMTASGLCEFGAHGLDHQILGHLEEAEQRRQITGSRQSLENILQRPVDLFAYPEGGEGHFNQTTIDILREEKFKSSPTAVFGKNSSEISPFLWRRNMVGFTADFGTCLGGQE